MASAMVGEAVSLGSNEPAHEDAGGVYDQSSGFAADAPAVSEDHESHREFEYWDSHSDGSCDAERDGAMVLRWFSAGYLET